MIRGSGGENMHLVLSCGLWTGAGDSIKTNYNETTYGSMCEGFASFIIIKLGNKNREYTRIMPTYNS